MKKGGQVILVVGLAFVALVGGALIARNAIIKFVIERGVKATTGVRLSIKKMDIGLTNAAVDIRGLKLHNPWGFHEDVMVSIPQVAVDVKARDLLKNRVHLEAVILRVDEFIVIKNEKGEVNINALKPIKEGQSAGQEQQADRAAGKAPKVQIDYLEYSIGKLIYKDYTQQPPKVQEFDLNVTRKYSNVTNPQFIASVIIADTITRTAVARLANVDMSGVTSVVSDTLRSGADSVGGAAQGVADSLRKLFNK